MSLHESVARDVANKIVQEHEDTLKIAESLNKLRGVDIESLSEEELNFLHTLFQKFSMSMWTIMFTMAETMAHVNSE